MLSSLTFLVFIPFPASTLEEVVARNYLLQEKPDALLNIVDGTNLERNLYLTTQLTELGIPVIIAKHDGSGSEKRRSDQSESS